MMQTDADAMPTDATPSDVEGKRSEENADVVCETMPLGALPAHGAVVMRSVDIGAVAEVGTDVMLVILSVRVVAISSWLDRVVDVTWATNVADGAIAWRDSSVVVHVEVTRNADDSLVDDSLRGLEDRLVVVGVISSPRVEAVTLAEGWATRRGRVADADLVDRVFPRRGLHGFSFNGPSPRGRGLSKPRVTERDRDLPCEALRCEVVPCEALPCGHGVDAMLMRHEIETARGGASLVGEITAIVPSEITVTVPRKERPREPMAMVMHDATIRVGHHVAPAVPQGLVARVTEIATATSMTTTMIVTNRERDVVANGVRIRGVRGLPGCEPRTARDRFVVVDSDRDLGEVDLPGCPTAKTLGGNA